jgi:putative DNA primase/helicase
MRRAKTTMKGLLTWTTRKLAALAGDDSDQAAAQRAKLKALGNWAMKSLDARRLKAMVELARSEPGIPVVPDDLDRNGWLLNLRNGTLDLKAATLRPHRQADNITRVCRVQYDSAATCPTWQRCLDRWQHGNVEMIGYLQRAVGYSLTADVGEQCLFFLHGDGANGKSVFLGTILALLGDYAIQAIAELLMMKHSETHPTERADLHGRRFVATIETEDGRRMAEALMKQLTGGDRIRARRMRQDFWEFTPTHKIWLAANHKPSIRGTDYATWRRVKVIPFAVTIPPEERDPHLPAKLQAERAGILAWAVRGCLEWQRRGLDEPAEVRAATEAYRQEQDVVSAWIAECCVTGPDYRCRGSALLASISAWCKTASETTPTQRTLGQRLETLGYERYTNNGTWYRRIAIRPDGTDGAEPPSG